MAAAAKQPERKAPAGGLRLELPIFETKTHPVTVGVTIDGRIGFLQSPKRKGRHTIVAR